MKIIEAIERHCCHITKDLREYHGILPKNMSINDEIRFCVHCGQLWWYTRSPGDMDYGYEILKLESL